MPDRRGRERTCSRKFRGEIRQINGALAIAGIGSRPRSRCRDGKSPAREDPRARRARASHTCRRSRLLSPCGCAPVDQRVAAAIGCHCTACYTQPRTALISAPAALPRIAARPDRIADACAQESAARRDLRLLGPCSRTSRGDLEKKAFNDVHRDFLGTRRPHSANRHLTGPQSRCDWHAPVGRACKSPRLQLSTIRPVPTHWRPSRMQVQLVPSLSR